MLAKLLTAALCTAAVSAEFMLYAVDSNQIIDTGAGFQQPMLMAFELGKTPACEDVGKANRLYPTPEGDLAEFNTGYACTGCYSPQTDIPVEGWDIKKIEMWNTGDQLFFDQDTGGIITYYQEWNGDTDKLIAADNKVWGECTRITERRDTFSCGEVIGSISGVLIFECYGYLSPGKAS